MPTIANEYSSGSGVDLIAMGAEVGNLVIIHHIAIFSSMTLGTVSAPLGWELLSSPNYVYAGTYAARQSIFYKIISSDDNHVTLTADQQMIVSLYQAVRVLDFLGNTLGEAIAKNSVDADWTPVVHASDNIYFSYSGLTGPSDTLWSSIKPANLVSNHTMIYPSGDTSYPTPNWGIAPSAIALSATPRDPGINAAIPFNFTIPLSETAQPVTLTDLTLSSNSAISGQRMGQVQGRQVGSSLTLINSANGAFSLSGSTIDVVSGTPAGPYEIVIRETNTNATNGPSRDTTLNVSVVDAMLTFIGVTYGNYSGAGISSINVPPHQVGDLLFGFMASNESGGLNAPSTGGWTDIGTWQGQLAYQGTCYSGSYYKIATEDAPTGLAVTAPGKYAGIAVYRPGAGWTIAHTSHGTTQSGGYYNAYQRTIPKIEPTVGSSNRFFIGHSVSAGNYQDLPAGTLTTDNKYVSRGMLQTGWQSMIFDSSPSWQATMPVESKFPSAPLELDHFTLVTAFNGTYTAPTVDDTAPTITSVPNPSVVAGTAFSHTLTASETATWTIVGGADQGLFSITGSTLSMTSQDWSGSNTRQVIIRATDAASNYTEQTITVTILAPSLNALTVSTNSLVVGTPFYTKFATLNGLTAGSTQEVTVISGPAEIDLGVEFGATTYVTWYGADPVPSSLAGQSKTLRITETLYGYSRSTDFTFTVVAVPITFVASATGTTNVVMPTHQAGDLLVLFMFRDGSTTTPALPAGWVNGVNGTGTSVSARLVHKIAGSSSETMGTATTATSCVVHVYRPGIGFTLSAGAAAIGAGSSTTVTYPALTLQDPSGKSWVATFAGHRSTNTNLQNPPAGSVNRATVVDATDEAAGHDTNGGVTSWTSKAVSVGGTSSGWEAASIEIKATSVTNSPTGKLFKVSII